MNDSHVGSVTFPLICSLIGMTLADMPRLDSGNSRAQTRSTPPPRRAPDQHCSGTSRRTRRAVAPSRRWTDTPGMVSSGCHSSVFWRNRNPSGITPTTVRWSAVHEEPPADDVWIIPIPRRPQARGDHDDWRRPRVCRLRTESRGHGSALLQGDRILLRRCAQPMTRSAGCSSSATATGALTYAATPTKLFCAARNASSSA
jgi:hypothetical protein